MVIRSVGVCLKPDQPDLGEIVRILQTWLHERGIEVVLGRQAAAAVGGHGLPRSELAEKVDLIVVLGGDGTLLAVARAIGSRPVPILGVNLGTLGYLAETSQDGLFEALTEVLAGRYRVEPRMRLDIEVERDGALLGRYLALNDAVIARTALSRMVDLEVQADGAAVATYHADGLIVATPTGSTAYSLSAGGPLLVPGVEAIVLTPICPHTLAQRPLVLPQTCSVVVRFGDPSEAAVQLTVDGQVGCELRAGDFVRIRRSENPAHLMVPPGRSRFDVMRAKLRWGER